MLCAMNIKNIEVVDDKKALLYWITGEPLIGGVIFLISSKAISITKDYRWHMEAGNTIYIQNNLTVGSFSSHEIYFLWPLVTSIKILLNTAIKDNDMLNNRLRLT